VPHRTISFEVVDLDQDGLLDIVSWDPFGGVVRVAKHAAVEDEWILPVGVDVGDGQSFDSKEFSGSSADGGRDPEFLLILSLDGVEVDSDSCISIFQVVGNDETLLRAFEIEVDGAGEAVGREVLIPFLANSGPDDYTIRVLNESGEPLSTAPSERATLIQVVRTFEMTDLAISAGPEMDPVETPPLHSTPWTALTACADFDRDGFADVAVLGSKSKVATILLGDREGSLIPLGAQGARKSYVVPLDGFTFTPFAIRVTDMNGDGFPDLVVAARGSVGGGVLDGRTEIGVWLANPAGTAGAEFQVSDAPKLVRARRKADGSPGEPVGAATSCVVADFNLDRIPDVALGTETDDKPVILLGKGTLTRDAIEDSDLKPEDDEGGPPLPDDG